MALILHKRSRYARVYREDRADVDGNRRGFMKATLLPQNYESVPDSGNYDTTIDLAFVSVSTSATHGISMTGGAPYQVSIQTGSITASSTLSQGAYSFTSDRSTAVMTFHPYQAAYLWADTGAILEIDPLSHYASAENSHAAQGSIDMGSHASTSSDSVVRWGYIEFRELNPGGGPIHDDLNLRYNFFPEYFKTDLQHLGAWRTTITPPASSTAEAYVGITHNVDWGNVTKILLANGASAAPTASFNDSAGNLEFQDAGGNAMAYVPQSYAEAASKAPFVNVARKTFWTSASQGKMHVGLPYTEMIAYSTFMHVSLPFALSTKDTALQGNVQVAYSYYDAPFQDALGWHYPAIGEYYGYRDDMFGLRFSPNLPRQVSLDKDGEYATLRTYPHPFRVGFGSAIHVNAVMDVKSANQPPFALDGANTIITGGSNWVDSGAAPTTILPNDHGFYSYDPLGDIDISPGLKALTGMPDWRPENAARLKVYPAASNPEYSEVQIAGNSMYSWGGDPQLNVLFTYPGENDQRTFSTDRAGVDISGGKASTTIEHAMGTQSRGRNNKTLLYIQAGEAIASGDSLAVGSTFIASVSTSASFTSMYALSSGEYGWVLTEDSITSN